MKIVCFGDSWGAGAELDSKTEFPFVYWLSHHYNCEYINYSKNGMSLGLVTKMLLDNSNIISSSDIVTVVIPPDIRWYTETEGRWKTIGNFDGEWEKFMKTGKTSEWFIYHHNLFIINIIMVLRSIGCKFVLMHNYGRLEIRYDNLIDDRYILSTKHSLTDMLNGDNAFAHQYDLEIGDDGPNATFKGKFFDGNLHHPNELGHKKIAELVIEYMENDNEDDI
jgi:hypothetical protein